MPTWKENSPHVDVTRLVAFLIDGKELSPAEHVHLIHCSQCRKLMATAAAEEIEKRKNERK